MFSIEALPALNAALNGIAAALLVAGFVFIRRGRVAQHRACMLSALGVSVLFLISYLTYHAQVGDVRYQGQGLIRAGYFAILIPHIILAAVVPPLALITASFGLLGRFDRHVKVARWTLPIWLYVSVTGVVIYAMLFL
ncbi:MAG TPA: DUF420 domain-containing protein [Vicinamibacterales bacterium]|jgi:uncharacterized membrane protein YozB (DUF420 family)